MITTADLKAQTRKELADLARNYGVVGWHALKKDDLVKEITKVQRKMRRASGAKAKASASKSTKPSTAKASGKSASRSTSPAAKSPAKAPVSKRESPAARSATGRSSATGSKTPKTAKSAGSKGKSITAKGSGSQPKASQLKASQLKASQLKASQPNGPKTSSPRASTAKTAAQKADQKRLNKPMPKLPEPRVDPKTARIRAQIRRRRETLQKNKDLSTGMLVAGSAIKNGTNRSKTQQPHQDRLVLMVRDAFWLQATWEITRASIQRAQSSLAERWHTAMPVLRVLHVGDVDGNSAESVARDIPIHGGVNNWYVDVDEPPCRFRVLVGYTVGDNDFYTLCRSNVVETPRPGECERLDEHWHDIAEDYERIYSLSGGYESDSGDLKEVFEERLHRAMPARGDRGQTVTEPSLLKQTKLPFKVDAELIVFGKTQPSASVQVGGRPVKLQPDGSFTVRMELPDKRQVLPVTAESRDGLRQRTTVVAVERNTKVMEPVELDDKI